MMQKLHRIVLWGNSIVLAGIETKLRTLPDVVLVRLDDRSPDFEHILRTEAFNLIVFDSNLKSLAQLEPLLQEFQNLVLLSINPNMDHALVLSSQLRAVTTMDDLIQVILHTNTLLGIN